MMGATRRSAVRGCLMALGLPAVVALGAVAGHLAAGVDGGAWWVGQMSAEVHYLVDWPVLVESDLRRRRTRVEDAMTEVLDVLGRHRGITSTLATAYASCPTRTCRRARPEW